MLVRGCVNEAQVRLWAKRHDPKKGAGPLELTRRRIAQLLLGTAGASAAWGLSAARTAGAGAAWAADPDKLPPGTAYVDLRRYDGPSEIACDLCIVGAGAAGITLALALARPGRRIIVLESGGFSFDGRTQGLYRGRLTGVPYQRSHLVPPALFRRLDQSLGRPLSFAQAPGFRVAARPRPSRMADHVRRGEALSPARRGLTRHRPRSPRSDILFAGRDDARANAGGEEPNSANRDL